MPVTASALKTTPVNAIHREMGASMVDFGSWDMPLHYGSQIEEHHHVRRDYGHSEIVQNKFAVAVKATPEVPAAHFVNGAADFVLQVVTGVRKAL